MTEPLRVLCFDDNKNVRDSDTVLLSTTKHIKVVAAYESYEGINECIRALKPDVVLRDIDMPVKMLPK